MYILIFLYIYFVLPNLSVNVLFDLANIFVLMDDIGFVLQGIKMEVEDYDNESNQLYTKRDKGEHF